MMDNHFMWLWASDYRDYFWLWGATIFVFGLCIGSFLNVAALRAFSGEAIILPPSKCPSCKAKIKWYDNIPVFSYYILLWGKCRACKCRISPQYAIVELTNGLLYFALFVAFGLSWKFLFLCVLMSLFILIAVSDLKEKVVFDHHTYPIIVLGLIYSLTGVGDINIWQSLAGIAVGFVFFEAIARLGYLVAPTRAFGEGDTIIAMGLGAFFGWKILAVIVALSILLQALLSIPILFYTSYKKKNYKTCTALALLAACIAVVVIFRYFDLYGHLIATGIMLVALVITLTWCTRVILGGMKQKTEKDLLYLPFGPALVFCATAVIFLADGFKLM
jgi:leader peptidase (prepilin peptidase)/N-methyltransferase